MTTTFGSGVAADAGTADTVARASTAKTSAAESARMSLDTGELRGGRVVTVSPIVPTGARPRHGRSVRPRGGSLVRSGAPNGAARRPQRGSSGVAPTARSHPGPHRTAASSPPDSQPGAATTRKRPARRPAVAGTQPCPHDGDRYPVPLPPRGRPLPSGAAAHSVSRPVRAPTRAIGNEGPAEATTVTRGRQETSADRFPALDAVRALAALGVVGFHAYKDLAGRPGWDSPLGTFGYSLQWAVPVFFVLSGFLLYRPFAAAIAVRGRRPDGLAFLLRRAARIFPAYWLALVVFGTLAKPGELWTADGVVRYGLLLHVLDGDTVYHVLGTAWSLSIEVAFYLALPLIAWLAAGTVRGRHGAWAHLAVLAALTIAAAAVTDQVITPLVVANGEDPAIAGFTLPGAFGPFAAGMALAVVSTSRRDLFRAAAWLPRPVRLGAAQVLRADGAWIALALLAYSCGLLFEARNIMPWDSTIYATLAALAVLTPLVLRPTTSRFARLLGGARPLVALGAISYGLYLWHWPIQELARTHGFAVPNSVLGWVAGFATMATLGSIAALVSYRLVETPVNRRVRALTARRSARPIPEEVGGLESGGVVEAP